MKPTCGSLVSAALVLLLFGAGACSPSNPDPEDDGGVIGSGGATPGTGGLIGSGGKTGSGGAGGLAGSGGKAGSGGAGGLPGSGGKTGSGGAGGLAGSGGKAGSGGAGSGGAAGSKFHVFLLLGQSNMAGYPTAQASDKVQNARIKVLGYDNCAATGRQTDVWATAVPPLHECYQGAIGPGDWFSKTLLNVIPANDTIGLVPCAISGEKIETFLKVGGTKYTWILNRAKKAQQAGGVIEGILFHQGESNNGDPAWPGKVKTLVTDLRTDLGIGDVPFLAGELAYDGGCAGHNTQVAKLPGLITKAYVISASGLALDPADTQWHLHFSHDAQVEFGKRYEAKMVTALGW